MKKLVLLLIVLFLLPIVFAQESTYNEIGDVEGDYRRSVGIFGQAGVNDEVTGNFVIDDERKWHPLVADFDGDGDIEYAILDGDNWKIFENIEVDAVDSYSIDVKDFITGAERYSNPLAFDIDGDGKVEIIYIQEKGQFLDILEYNGTNFFPQLELNITNLQNTGKTVEASSYNIKCSETNKCLMTYNTHDRSGFGGSPLASTWFGSYFNSTFAGHTSKLVDISGFQFFCHPNARSMALADYDNDGEKEFISTFIEAQLSADDKFHIIWVEVLDNGTVELESHFVEDTDMQNIYNGDINFRNRCNGEGALQILIPQPNDFVRLAGNHITNPVTFDFDGSASNGLETMVGFHSETSSGDKDFNLMIKSYDGCSSDEGFETSCTISKIDDYPELCDGVLEICGSSHFISNLWRTNAFPDTSASAVDVCVAGTTFSTSESDFEVDVICASEQKSSSIFIAQDTETHEIILGIDVGIEAVPFNISTGLWLEKGLVNNIWFSTQHSSETLEGQNVDEVSTPYGILRQLLDTPVSPVWEIFFANPEADGVMIPVDPEVQGSEDLLLYTGGNLFYIDDGLANSGAIITNVSFNPCPIDAILKINTTLNIQVIVKDQNPETLPLDPVTARVSVYNDDGNEFNDLPQEFNNITSGAVLPYSFTLNKTIVNGEILIEGFDSENSNDIDSKEFVLNVQLNGLEFGDSECSVGFVADPDGTGVGAGVFNLTAGASGNDGITGFVEGGSNLFGVTPLIFVLILMLGFTISVLTTSGGEGSTMVTLNKVLFLIFGNGIIFLIGAIIGAIPFGVLLVVIILAIFGIVLWARRMFTGEATQ